MDKKLRVLMIEDSENDSLIVLREIRRAGYQPEHVRTETAHELNTQLGKGWDVILCDYIMPQFSAPEALKIVKKFDPDMPFLIVSGNIGEESAVEAMRLGAHDYIMKDNLKRLIPAIEREVEEAQIRRERKQTQQALQASQANYHEIFNGVNDAIFMLDPQSGKIIDLNQKVCEHTGYKRKELLNLSLDELSDQEKKNAQDQIVYRLKNIQRDQSLIYETTINKKNNESYWAEINLKRTSIAGKEVILGVARDITDRKHAIEALARSEERFRSIVENSHDSIMIVDDKFKIKYFNQNFARLVEVKEQQLINYDFREFLKGKTRELVADRYKRRQSGTEIDDEYEIDFQTHSGKEKRLLLKASLITDSKGNKNTLAQLLDITDKYLSEQELRSSEEQYRNVVENASDAIFIVQDGVIQFANNKTYQLFKYPTEELAKTNWDQIIYPGDSAELKDKIGPLDGKNSANMPPVENVRLVAHDGTLVWAELTRIPIEFAGKKATLNFAKDVSQQKKLEDRLKLAQKMEAIGTLAGGIAHDFNNILSPIMGYTEITIEELPDDSHLRENLEQVYLAANRAKDLVQQILTFSREVEQEPRPLKIQLVLGEALKLLKASIPSTIEIQSDIDNDCSPVIADPTQIHQIIMNLCTNAYQSMIARGGLLSVKLKEIQLERSDILDFSELKSGSYAQITVSDTGHGMEKNIIERIFDPFFTTKQKEHGTGMGLSVVHGIVKSYNGHIDVYSEVGKGSTFKIYLPCSIRRTTEQKNRLEEINPSGNERILLVDDEKAIATMVEKMLSGLGYQITYYTSSIDALDAFHKNPDQFDLVISDKIMPQMNGEVLAANVYKIRPDIPIILVTGFADQLNLEKLQTIGIRELIVKPVLRSEIAAAIRRVLDQDKS